MTSMVTITTEKGLQKSLHIVGRLDSRHGHAGTISYTL
jgi:hypothetical protein